MDVSSDVRRVVTGHDETGKAVVLLDGANPRNSVRPATGTVNRLLWVTGKAPASISGSADRGGGDVGVAPPSGGSIFRVVDFPPTTDEDIAKFDCDFLSKQILHDVNQSPQYREPSHPFMHRTRSIDYAVVMSGEIDMKLDDAEVHLKAGDTVIQQGTNHAWINRSSEVCRIAFILIDAEDPLPL